MNWYKTAQENVKLQEELKKVHPSLLKNIYFLSGADSESYPEGIEAMKKLTGEEWRKARDWIWAGVEWRLKITYPEEYEKRKERKRLEREKQEMANAGNEKWYSLREWERKKQDSREDMVKYFSDPGRLGRVEEIDG